MLGRRGKADERNSRGRLGEVPLFVGSYLTVWMLVGVAIYVLDRPHGTFAAGVVVIAAGVYEMTPLKRHFRWCCRESTRSGPTASARASG
jgi:predicted metal-binding membrane protein